MTERDISKILSSTIPSTAQTDTAGEKKRGVQFPVTSREVRCHPVAVTLPGSLAVVQAAVSKLQVGGCIWPWSQFWEATVILGIDHKEKWKIKERQLCYAKSRLVAAEKLRKSYSRHKLILFIIWQSSGLLCWEGWSHWRCRTCYERGETFQILFERCG